MDQKIGSLILKKDQLAICMSKMLIPSNMKYHPKTWFSRLVLDLFILGPLYREFHIGWDDFLTVEPYPGSLTVLPVKWSASRGSR